MPQKFTGKDARAMADLTAKLARLKAPAPCIYRDDKPYTSEPCMTCKGKVKADAYKCAKHGRCLIATTLPGFANCRICPDRKPPEATP